MASPTMHPAFCLTALARTPSSKAPIAPATAARLMFQPRPFGTRLHPSSRSFAYAAVPSRQFRSEPQNPRDDEEKSDKPTFTHPELEEGEPEMLGLEFLQKKAPTVDADVFELSLWAMSSRVVYPLPEDRVQLHIFEERFRTMYNEVLAEEPHLYGCVWFDPTNGLVASVGVSCEITEHQRLPDGRILFDSEPRRRFQVVDVVQQAPFLKCRVKYIEDLPAAGPEEEVVVANLEKNAVEILTDLLRLSDKISGQGAELPSHISRWLPEAPEAAGMPAFERASTLSLVLCSVLELAPKDRQFLLQTRDLPLRLRIVGEVLDRARKLLAAKASLKDAFN